MSKKLYAGKADDEDVPDWMRDHTAQQQVELRAQRGVQRAERLRKAKAKLRRSNSIFGAAPGAVKDLSRANARPPGKGPAAPADVAQSSIDISPADAEFLLDDWDSEGEEHGSKRKSLRSALPGPLAFLSRSGFRAVSLRDSEPSVSTAASRIFRKQGVIEAILRSNSKLRGHLLHAQKPTLSVATFIILRDMIWLSHKPGRLGLASIGFAPIASIGMCSATYKSL